MKISLLILLLFNSTVSAAIYYVRTDGNDGNSGLVNNAGGAKLTIGGAASVATTAGDIVRVQAGTYNERVALTADGNSGAWINYVCDGTVICRGFDLTGVNYTRLIGFEITHTTIDYQDGIKLLGTCTHIDILDNNIHDVNRSGISVDTGVVPSYITIRGNTIFYTGHVPGVFSTAASSGIGSYYITPHHWLAEYNTITRVGDAIFSMFGTNNIIRNNSGGDIQNAYWSEGDSIHADIFQDGSDGAVAGSRHHLYEANFFGDALAANSHFGLWQDTSSAGDTNMLIRGNILFSFGGGGIGVVSTDKVAAYNNTFYKMSQTQDGAVAVYYGTDPALNGLFANTIIEDAGIFSDVLYTQGGSTTTFTFNLGYQAGSEPSYVSTSDPLFVDPESGRNFHIQAGSPAIDTGTAVATVTSANGSGTTFNVSDGQLFTDGWGIVDGDKITVGGTTTRITGISGNTVTVADSVTWTNGMDVYWWTDTDPDIGALPYGSSDLTEAELLVSGTTYTVNTVGDTRGVWFYVDGIPTTWDSTPPYSTTIASGEVSAKAYAQYAQSVPVFDALPLTVTSETRGKSQKRGKTHNQ